jgi:hypothetical protein
MGWKSHRKPLKSLKTAMAIALQGRQVATPRGWGSLGVKKVAENDA